MIYLAFLVIFILAGLWIFKQGRQVEYYKKSFKDELEFRKAQSSHISFIEAENRRFEDRIKKFEASLAHLDPGHEWRLRDSPDSIPTNPHTNTKRDPKSED